MDDEPKRKDSLLRTVLKPILTVELLVGVTLAGIWLLIYDTPDFRGALLTCAGLYVLRLGSWLLALRQALAPVQALADKALDTLDDDALRQLARTTGALPVRMTVVFVVGWVFYYVGLATIAWFNPQLIALGRAELLAAGLQVLAVALGTVAVVRPLVEFSLDGFVVEVRTELDRRGANQAGSRAPVLRRLIAVAAILVIGPVLWDRSMAWLVEVQATRKLVETELRGELLLSAQRRDATSDPVDDPLEGEQRIVDTLPPTLAALEADHHGARTHVDLHGEAVEVAVALADGRWLLARRSLSHDHDGYLALTLALLFALVIWGLASAAATAGAIMAPLRRLRIMTRRLADTGDLRTMARVPMVRNDEVGDLTQDFNVLLSSLEQLAEAAQAVGRGDLSVSIDGEGDLARAFTRMVEQLRSLLLQLRVTASSVADAAAEIQAATEEQDLAANQQRESMQSLQTTMVSLAGSATQIAAAVTGVQQNAERNLANSDEMTREINELSARSQGIGELLELIRDISDRSDILALNGALEATRAGEVGRGFALVSGEMRRLAERVSGTVAKVRDLVADINVASVSTVMASAHGRDLAEDTTRAAREIADEIRRQSGETEQALAGVGEVAGLLEQIGQGTHQSRRIAEGLGLEAANLEQLLDHFDLDDQ